MDNQIKETKSKRLKIGLVTYLGLPVGIFIFFIVVLATYGMPGKILGLVALAALVFIEIRCYKQFKELNGQVKYMEGIKQDMLSNMRSMRQAIAEVVKRPDLDEEQQKAAIRNILNGNYER